MRLKIHIMIGAVSLLVIFVSLLSLPLAGNVRATATMLPESEDTFEFTNNEAEDAYDLHIHWSRAVTVKEAKPFKKKEGSGTSRTDLSNGVVKTTGKASVTVSWDGSTDAKVEEWWWTKKGGDRLGEEKKGNPSTAMSPGLSGAGKASLATANGLYIITVDNVSGRVIVNLPDDMRAGDTISGTVVAEPKGNTNDERKSNTAKLSEIKLNLGAKFPKDKKELMILITPRIIIRDEESSTPSPNQTHFTTKVPDSFDYTIGVNAPSADAQTVTITINEPIWFINNQPTTPPRTETPPSRSDFHFPDIIQQGRTGQISGPNGKKVFDGNSANTRLMYGPAGSSVQDFEKNTENVSGGFGLIKPLAKSPRQCVFEVPTTIAGPVQLYLKVGALETVAPSSIVGLNLSGKTNLIKNEHTDLKIDVFGLQGIRKPVPLTLEAAGVIRLHGGNYQQFMIQPSQVNAQGRYTTTFGGTGVEVGAWSATVTVVTQPFNIVLRDPDPPQTILINSFTGDYAFCGSGPKLTGTGQIKRQGCIIELRDNKPDRVVQGMFNACLPVDNARSFTFYSAGTITDIKITVTDTQPPRRKIYFNPLNRPMPPVQDTSAFATCP